MKVLLDTSVLVPWFLGSHPDRERCRPWRERIARGEVKAAIALHSVAETYAVVSVYPSGPPLPSEGLQEMLVVLLKGPLTVVEPTAADYHEAVEDLVNRDLRGGIVYDALLLRAARRTGADLVLTFNHRDFRRLAPDLADRIRAP